MSGAVTHQFIGFKALSANFTPTPNQFFDKIVGHYQPCVVSVVAILIRSTLGWEDADTGERRVEAELPMTAFIRPELSEQSVRRGLTGAIEAGFIVRTISATPREPARYALRWSDAAAQERAILRQRAADAVGSPHNRGAKLRGTKKRPLNLRGTNLAPPYNNDSEKKSSSEKKSKNSERKSTGKSFLPAASSEEEKSDVLSLLPADEYAALEQEARTLVIAETGPPVSDLARQGKANTVVKRRMRELLAARQESVPIASEGSGTVQENSGYGQ